MSKHFKESEFKCKCCGHAVVAPELYEALEALRYHMGNNEIRIVSGYRCHTYNSKLQGAAKNSQHMLGRAADVQVFTTTTDGCRAQIDPSLVAEVAGRMVPQFSRGGIGRYPTFTHVDVRGAYGMPRARWKGSRK
jgi:zinc D-Ala-D-Ala carboxypeptidase